MVTFDRVVYFFPRSTDTVSTPPGPSEGRVFFFPVPVSGRRVAKCLELGEHVDPGVATDGSDVRLPWRLRGQPDAAGG